MSLCSYSLRRLPLEAQEWYLRAHSSFKCLNTRRVVHTLCSAIEHMCPSLDFRDFSSHHNLCMQHNKHSSNFYRRVITKSYPTASPRNPSRFPFVLPETPKCSVPFRPQSDITASSPRNGIYPDPNHRRSGKIHSLKFHQLRKYIYEIYSVSGSAHAIRYFAHPHPVLEIGKVTVCDGAQCIVLQRSNGRTRRLLHRISFRLSLHSVLTLSSHSIYSVDGLYRTPHIGLNVTTRYCTITITLFPFAVNGGSIWFLWHFAGQNEWALCVTCFDK